MAYDFMRQSNDEITRDATKNLYRKSWFGLGPWEQNKEAFDALDRVGGSSAVNMANQNWAHDNKGDPFATNVLDRYTPQVLPKTPGPTSGVNGAGAWQVVDNSKVVQAPPDRGATHQANFGSYTDDARGALDKLGMFNGAGGGGGGGSSHQAIIDRYKGFNDWLGGLSNPWGEGNAVLQGQLNRASENRGLANARGAEHLQQSLAMRGLDQSSGIGAESERAFRLANAQQEGGAQTQARMDNYAKADDWDRWKAGLQLQGAQAMSSTDLGNLNYLMQKGQQDALLPLQQQQMAQNISQSGQRFPLELQGMQYGLQGQQLGLQGQQQGLDRGAIDLGMYRATAPYQQAAQISQFGAVPEQTNLALNGLRREDQMQAANLPSYMKQLEHEQFWAPLSNLTNGVQRLSAGYRSIATPDFFLGPGGTTEVLKSVAPIAAKAMAGA